MTAVDATIPKHLDLLYPTLQALKDLGGSARIDEIMERVVEREGFTDEQVAVRRSPDHHMGLLEYRLAWARNYLKNVGAVENSARGEWTITPLGRELTEADVRERVKAWKADYNRSYYEQKKRDAADEEEESEGGDAEVGWKERLLDRLLTTSADAFERLAQRLLKEAGFRNVEVLGKSGDGGIDGVGVYRLSLVSFPVFFQCKRYKGRSPRPPCVISEARCPAGARRGCSSPRVRSRRMRALRPLATAHPLSTSSMATISASCSASMNSALKRDGASSRTSQSSTTSSLSCSA